jgi:hypothetical protein
MSWVFIETFRSVTFLKRAFHFKTNKRKNTSECYVSEFLHKLTKKSCNCYMYYKELKNKKIALFHVDRILSISGSN